MLEEIPEEDLEKIQELKEKIKAGDLNQDKKGLTEDEMRIFVLYPEEFLSPEDLERIKKEGERTREILKRICVRDRNPGI